MTSISYWRNKFVCPFLRKVVFQLQNEDKIRTTVSDDDSARESCWRNNDSDYCQKMLHKNYLFPRNYLLFQLIIYLPKFPIRANNGSIISDF